MLFSASGKANCLQKTLLVMLILITPIITAFPSGTNLKLHNIHVTPKFVKKVKTKFDLSKAFSLGCIPVVVLKCWIELSYVLAEHFNKCRKEYCFPDCWKVSSVVPVFKNVGERSMANIGTLTLPSLLKLPPKIL